MKTQISAQNATWLDNRPMWKADKTDRNLQKHPARWLSTASYKMAERRGWLDRHDLAAFNHAVMIKNSIAKRSAK